ncbi:Uncharacterised protein [Mycobacteroides abscessus]|nr:Uncharacterised protein [Mycobacteroides abscessus]
MNSARRTWTSTSSPKTSASTPDTSRRTSFEPPPKSTVAWRFSASRAASPCSVSTAFSAGGVSSTVSPVRSPYHLSSHHAPFAPLFLAMLSLRLPANVQYAVWASTFSSSNIEIHCTSWPGTPMSRRIAYSVMFTGSGPTPTSCSIRRNSARCERKVARFSTPSSCQVHMSGRTSLAFA